MNTVQKRDQKIQDISWKEALNAHFLLFGYWLTPKRILQNLIEVQSKKLRLISLVNAIVCSVITTFALLGILDGQEVITELLQLNIYVWSKMLFNYGIYSFLLIFSCVFGISFIFPLLLRLTFNKLLPKEKRKSNSSLLIVSSYSILSILFYSPVIFIIFMLSLHQNPQLAQLMPQEYWDGFLYSFISLGIFSIVVSCYGQKKMLGYLIYIKN